MQRNQLLGILLFVLFISGGITCADDLPKATNVSVSNSVTKLNENVTAVNENAPTVHENAPTTHEDTTTVTSTVASTGQNPSLTTTTDVCGLSLVTLSEEDEDRNRKCACSDFHERVDCSYLDVTTLPKLISFPKSARDVSFVGNRIENIAEDTFYNGRYVVDLDLSHNRIDFVSIVAFRAFKNLRRLTLSHNNIWNMPPKSFDGLSLLRFLDLGYNELSTLSSDLFAAVPNLTELYLESNPLKELEPKLFEHLKYLEILKLQSTLLKVVPDHLFVFTPHLKVLDLSGNLLENVPSDALKFLHRLTLLNLSGNPIKTVKEAAFVGMRVLVVLYLDKMPLLTKIEKYAFGDLQLLQELHCSYNFLLSEVDEKAFIRKADNQKVELAQLFLRQNSLSSIPKELLDWNDNVELHLSDNPISCDCHTEWMVHLKIKNDFQEHAKCFYPSHFQGIPLAQMKDSDMVCGLELSEMVMIVLAGVIFLLILALIIAFLVWRRHYFGYTRPYFRVSKKKNIDVDYRGDDAI